MVLISMVAPILFNTNQTETLLASTVVKFVFKEPKSKLVLHPNHQHAESHAKYTTGYSPDFYEKF